MSKPNCLVLVVFQLISLTHVFACDCGCDSSFESVEFTDNLKPLPFNIYESSKKESVEEKPLPTFFATPVVPVSYTQPAPCYSLPAPPAPSYARRAPYYAPPAPQSAPCYAPSVSQPVPCYAQPAPQPAPCYAQPAPTFLQAPPAPVPMKTICITKPDLAAKFALLKQKLGWFKTFSKPQLQTPFLPCGC